MAAKEKAAILFICASRGAGSQLRMKNEELRIADTAYGIFNCTSRLRIASLNRNLAAYG